MQSSKIKSHKKTSSQSGPPPPLQTCASRSHFIAAKTDVDHLSAETQFATQRDLLGQLLQLTQTFVSELLQSCSKRQNSLTEKSSAHSSRSSSRDPEQPHVELLYPENVPSFLASIATKASFSEIGGSPPCVSGKASLNVITPVSKTELYKTLLPSANSDASFNSSDFNNSVGTPHFVLERFKESCAHLRRLGSRIQETRSRLLVTGDLNAGKSTFVNALMRRRIVPSDQQPCTSCFVEVIDAKENSSLEEIHAIPTPEANPMPSFHELNASYSQLDKSSYDLCELEQLRSVVLKNEASHKYSMLKVYCKDAHAAQSSSLLHNGVIDVSIIDSPGLNIDVAKTLALFSQQEEIDVIVFMVHAENQFTLSGKEFLEAAGKEKAFVFVVVNRYDQIENKKRCKKDILEQLRSISPDTHDDSEQLVHFVSSREFLGAKLGKGRRARRRSPSPDMSQSISSESDEPEVVDFVADFELMEQRLKEFIIHRRSQSKLAPAKLYLQNLIDDLRVLTAYNFIDQKARQESLRGELDEMQPQVEELRRAEKHLIDMDHRADNMAQFIYTFVKTELESMIEELELDVGELEWYGIFSMDAYAHDIQAYLQSSLMSRSVSCQSQAFDQCYQFASQLQHFAASIAVPIPTIEMLLSDWSDFGAQHENHGKSVNTKQLEHASMVQWNEVLNITDQWQVVKSTIPSLGIVCLGLVSYQQIGRGLLSVSSQLVGTANLAKLFAVGLVVAGGAYFFVTIGNLPGWIVTKVHLKWKRYLKQSKFAETEARRISHKAQQSLRSGLSQFSSSFRRKLDANNEHKTLLEHKMLSAQISCEYWKKMCNKAEDLVVCLNNVSLN